MSNFDRVLAGKLASVVAASPGISTTVACMRAGLEFRGDRQARYKFILGCRHAGLIARHKPGTPRNLLHPPDGDGPSPPPEVRRLVAVVRKRPGITIGLAARLARIPSKGASQYRAAHKARLLGLLARPVAGQHGRLYPGEVVL